MQKRNGKPKRAVYRTRHKSLVDVPKNNTEHAFGHRIEGGVQRTTTEPAYFGVSSLSGPDESFEVTATEANYQVAAKQPQAVRSRPSLKQHTDPPRRGRKRSFVSRNSSQDPELSQKISKDEGLSGEKYHRTLDRLVPDAAYPTNAVDFASNSPQSTVRMSVNNYQTFPISPQHVPPVEDDLSVLAAFMYPTSLPHGEGYSIPDIYYQPDVPFPADFPVDHNPVSDLQLSYERNQQYPFSWNVPGTIFPSPAGHLSLYPTSREVDPCLLSSASADFQQSDLPMSSDFGQYKRL